MKKFFWALSAAMMLIACDPIEKENDPDKEQTENQEGEGGNQEENGGNQEGEGGNQEGNGGNQEGDGGNDNPTPDGNLQPSEQKVKISEVGQKLIDKVPSSEWEAYAELANDFANSVYVSDDYDWGKVEDWFYDGMEEAYVEERTLKISSNQYTNEFITEVVILMANHTGLFTCTENGVTISDYDGTKAVFSLNGKSYEAEIKSSGKVTQAVYPWNSRDEYESYDYFDPAKGEWVYTDSPVDYVGIETISVTVGIPEKINVSIKEDGDYLAEIDIQFTPSFSKENINLTTDSFSTVFTVSMNGFEVVSEKIAYDGAKGQASYKTALKKNGQTLFSSSASGDVQLKEETENHDDGDYKYNYTYVIVSKAKNIQADFDLLGEIQGKGSCTNAVEAFESLNAMWDALYSDYGNNPDLNEAERHLDNFNAKFNIGVYYDGGNKEQAKIKFDLSAYANDYGDSSYDLIPIIEFNDGSKYKIEEFFTEDAFEELIDNFYALCDSFSEVFGFSVEDDH